MEDYGTATVLGRFGRLDRYVSVRGVADFDRPSPGQSVAESLREGAVEHDSTSPRSQTSREDAGALAVELAVENAFRPGPGP